MMQALDDGGFIGKYCSIYNINNGMVKGGC